MKRALPVQALGILVCATSVAWAVDTVETRGKVDAVTVYRGQAYVTRKVEVPGPAMLREVVVTGLPEHVVPGSIYAESADGVEVRSVRYRIRPVQEDVREEVRELDEQLRLVADEINANQRHTQLLGEHRTYLDKLEQFVAPTANIELTKGVLNAETLKSLTSFLFEARTKLADEELKLSREHQALADKQELLRRERQVLTGTSARTAREAVVFVNLLKDEGGRLRLRYLVDHATWTPSYTIRTDENRRQATVDYYASIQQMSGEDWTDVEMTLSTATPSLVAKAPVLTPLTVTLAAAHELTGGKGQQARVQGEDYYKTNLGLKIRKSRAARERASQPAQQRPQGQYRQELNESEMPASFVDWDLTLNTLALKEQVLDLTARGKVTRKDKPPRAKTEEGVSVSYQLTSRTALPSRADRQLIQIASLGMKSEFYKLAVPVLTSYVYEEAAVTNDSGLVLLSGPVSTYLGGQFVGHGAIPMVAVGESFTVGFGIDPSLRGDRELVEKTESIQGGNRVVKFTYRLGVENFGTEPAAVRLLDRLPKSRGSEVEIKLISPGAELSSDASYMQSEQKKGILRWEVEVPPEAIGPEALAVEYQFCIEYDRQMTIVGLPITGS